jgi:hypothetical protein
VRRGGTTGVNGSTVNGRCGPAVRIPLVVISPYAKQNYVDHTLIDQSSVVRFIEDNWLGGQRIGGGSFDAVAGDLATCSTSRRSRTRRRCISIRRRAPRERGAGDLTVPHDRSAGASRAGRPFQAPPRAAPDFDPQHDSSSRVPSPTRPAPPRRAPHPRAAPRGLRARRGRARLRRVRDRVSGPGAGRDRRGRRDWTGANPHPVVLQRPPCSRCPRSRSSGALFFDPSLSASGKQSCASCHSPDHAYGRRTRSTCSPAASR